MENILIRQAKDKDIEAFYRPGKNEDFNEWEFADNHPENPYIKIKFIDSNMQVSGAIKYCDSFYDEHGNLL